VDNSYKPSNLTQAWLVLLLAFCFGSALAAVQIQLSGPIAENKRNETLSKIPALVFGADRAAQLTNQNIPLEIAAGTITIEKTASTISYPIYRVSHGEQPAGWVIKGSGQGYSGKIELLLGLDSLAKTLTGLFILEQKETPGLGNKIIFPQWRNQFIHKNTARPLSLRKNSAQKATPAGAGNTIDAITGATISSRAVTAIVNDIVGNTKGNLTPDHIQYFERQM
jgi:electron transport complex protein RnfG